MKKFSKIIVLLIGFMFNLTLPTAAFSSSDEPDETKNEVTLPAPPLVISELGRADDFSSPGIGYSLPTSNGEVRLTPYHGGDNAASAGNGSIEDQNHGHTTQNISAQDVARASEVYGLASPGVDFDSQQYYSGPSQQLDRVHSAPAVSPLNSQDQIYAALRNSQWRIMWADDSAINRKLLHAWMISFFKVEGASSSSRIANSERLFSSKLSADNGEAIFCKFVHTHKYLQQQGVDFTHTPVAHAVFLDMQMGPGMTGAQVASAIRAYENDHHIKQRSPIFSWSTETDLSLRTLYGKAFAGFVVDSQDGEAFHIFSDDEIEDDWQHFNHYLRIQNVGKPFAKPQVVRAVLETMAAKYDLPGSYRELLARKANSQTQQALRAVAE